MGSEELIESTAVPDHVLMNEQMELNQAIASGELSGPALVVNGRPSAALEQKRLEAAQRAALATLTLVIPGRKQGAPDPEEKPADKARMREAQSIFEALPKPSADEVDHLATPRAQLEAFRAFLTEKWAPPAPPPPPNPMEQVQAILGPPPAPQSLRLRDGRFHYEALQQALSRLQEAEAWAEANGGLRPVQGSLDAFRNAVASALQLGGRAAPAAPAAAAPPPAAAKPKAPPPPPARPPEAVAPPEPQGPDPAQLLAEELAQRQALHLLPLEARREQLAQALAEGRGPGDEALGRLASSIALDAPELVDPDLVPLLDAYGFQHLLVKAPFALFVTPPPKARVAVMKALVAVEGEALSAAAAELAGRMAAELIRQHPRALGELVGPMPGPGRGKMIAVALAGLDDESLGKYSREALQSLGRAMGPPTTEELRRQSSRLLRLADGR